MSTTIEAAETNGYQSAGPADLAPGKTACRTVAGVRVIVARAQDGAYFVVGAMCSHAMLPLDEGRVRGGSIVCPHHGARFDLKSGRVLGPPASAPIAAWPTRVEGDEVRVWLG